MAESARSMSIAPADSRQSVAALCGLLDDLASVVAPLDVEAYTARPLSHASGSIGAHVRHCLDHVGSLLSAQPAAVLSYDHRERGTAVEGDPAEALRRIMRLKAAFDRWPIGSLEEPILVRAKTSASFDETTMFSTIGREVAFVVSHTIHHQALISVLLELLGQAAPDRFGYAPSTPSRS